MTSKLERYLVTWEETERVPDMYDPGPGNMYSQTVYKYAIVIGVDALQKYVNNKSVKFYELGSELSVKLKTTVEVKTTVVTR